MLWVTFDFSIWATGPNSAYITCGNPRKQLTLPAWWTTYSWIFLALSSFFPNHADWFSSWLVKVDPTFITSNLFTRVGYSHLHTDQGSWILLPYNFFDVLSWVVGGTLHTLTFSISSCCNVWTIVALPALCEKYAAISRCISVIMKWLLSQEVCIHIAQFHLTSYLVSLYTRCHVHLLFLGTLIAITECF